MRLANENNYHLVISELILPDMSGVEIARSLDNVMIVGNYPLSENELSAFKRDGVKDYVQKPFSIKRLVDRITSLI